MKRSLRFLVVCVSIVTVCCAIATAQNNRASITGTVQDASGAVVVGAQVVARNVETGIETKTVSNSRGIYSVPNLAPGNYELRIAKEGFKPVEFLHVALILDQVAELNATMAPGATAETVTVVSGAPVLETETSTVGTNMNGNVVTDMPLNVYGGRQAEYFAVALTPGYSPLSDPYTAIINGNQGFTKDFTIDGTTGTAQIQGDIFETGPSMEAIEELHAETSGLSAENGNTNGGLIMLGLKSGTNQFHGSAFGYGHNELLDANTFDNNALKAECLAGDIALAPCGNYNKGESRFWDWGFSAGGPIIKNKTFIFGTFERYTQNDFTPGGFGATVPTTAFLQGNFSGLLGSQICTDGTTVPCSSGGTPMTVTNDAGQTVPLLQGTLFDPTTGNAFTGNMIPTSMFSSVSQKIVAIYQKSYAPAFARDRGNNRLPASNSPAQTPNEIDIKVDHNLTANDKLSGSWVYNHRPRTLIDSGGVWSPGTTDGGPFADSRFQMVKADEYRLTEAHTFTPTLLNVLNATYNWYWNGSSPLPTTNFPQQLGFGNTGAVNFPVINFGPQAWNGLQETGIGNSWQGHYAGATYVYGDQMTWSKGRHTFNFGGEFRAMQLNSQGGSGALTMNFQPKATADPDGTSATGFGFADFLLGNVASASETTPFNLYGRRKAMSLYAQDDFKVNRKLALNLGLRWDVNFRLHEKDGNWANFDLNAIDPNLGIKGAIVYAKNGSDSFEKNQDFKNFAPQIGFAYNPWEKVVFRGSVGMLYVPMGIQYWTGIPYGFDPALRGTNAAPGAFDWDNGYPGVFTPGTKSSTPSLFQFPLVSVNPDALKAGYSETLNLGVQYELTNTSRIEASYIGNRGHRLIGSNLAYDEASPTAFMNLYNSGNFGKAVCDPATAASIGVPYPYPGFCGPSQAAIAPYPQAATGMDWYIFYPNIYYVGMNKGQSFYNSMVIHYVKRTGHGLVADVSYTLSRQEWDTYTNFTDSYDVGLGSIQNYGNLSEAAHTLSPYDQKHVIKAGIQYELPFGKGHEMLGRSGRVVNALVSGWKISPLLTYATGKPLSFYANDEIYGPYYPSWSAIYVDYNLAGYNGRSFSPSNYVFGSQTAPQNRYFPTSIASDPALGTLGTGPVRVDQLRGFGTDREDVSLHKSFTMRERYSMDFAVEFYNVLNRHGFADPDTSDPSSTTFGMITATSGNPRNGQFEARFRW